MIYSEIHEKAIIQAKNLLIEVSFLILNDSVLICLTGKLIFKLERDNWYSVYRYDHIDGFVCRSRKVELPSY